MTEYTQKVTANIIYYSTNKENNNNNALYLILSKNEELSSDDTTVVDIGFIHTLDESNKTQVRLKTWDEVIAHTNVDFLTMVNQFATEIINGDDDAKICAEQGEDYEEFLELCKNIADSIKLDGQIPEDAGALFKAYYKTQGHQGKKPKNPTVH